MRRTLLLLALLLLLPSPVRAQDMTLSGILRDGENWTALADKQPAVAGLAVNKAGVIYLTEIGNKAIYRIVATGRREEFATASAPTCGLAFGPDGRLFGCQPEKKRIVAFDADGKKETPILERFAATDLTVSANGVLYFSVPSDKAIYAIRQEKLQKVAEDISAPAGLALWPDRGTLVVADADSKYLWTFRVEKNGSITCRDRYYELRLRAGQTAAKTTALTVDQTGRIYAATDLGIQCFDPTGRLIGVIHTPKTNSITALTFGGAERDTFVLAGDSGVFQRKAQAKGVSPPK
jgi:enterochelin esterase family protein